MKSSKQIAYLCKQQWPNSNRLSSILNCDVHFAIWSKWKTKQLIWTHVYFFKLKSPSDLNFDPYWTNSKYPNPSSLKTYKMVFLTFNSSQNSMIHKYLFIPFLIANPQLANFSDLTLICGIFNLVFSKAYFIWHI